MTHTSWLNCELSAEQLEREGDAFLLPHVHEDEQSREEGVADPIAAAWDTAQAEGGEREAACMPKRHDHEVHDCGDFAREESAQPGGG